MYVFSRQVGMSLGVGIGATTFQNVMSLKLKWEGLPTSIATHAEAYIPTLHALPYGTTRDVIYDSYKFGIQIVFAVALALSVVALILTVLFMKNVNMDRKLDTEHILDDQRMARHWGRKEQALDSDGKQ